MLRRDRQGSRRSGERVCGRKQAYNKYGEECACYGYNQQAWTSVVCWHCSPRLPDSGARNYEKPALYEEGPFHALSRA